MARRLAGVGAKVVTIVVAIALLSAVTYEQIGSWRDSRVLKQIGRRRARAVIAWESDVRAKPQVRQ